MMNDMREHFRKRIEGFSRVRRGIANATLAYRFGAVLCAAVLVLLALPAVRLEEPLLDAALLAALSLLLPALAGCYLWRRLRFRGHLHEAFRMEDLAGGLNSRLISALDFLDRRDASPLMHAAIAAADRDLDKVKFEAMIDRTAHIRARRRFVAVLVCTLILGATSCCGFNRLASRAYVAWLEVRERLFPTEWELMPGPGRHIRLLGDKVEVTLRFTRNGFGEVTVIQDETDNRNAGETRRMLPVAADGTARVSLQGNRQRSQRVVFAFGRHATRTKPVEIVFTTRPAIENMQIELIPPLYTRQPPRELGGVQTRIAGLPGTRVSLGLTFSKSLASATVRFDGDSQDTPLDVIGRFAAIQFVIADSRRARIQAKDVHGFTLLQPHTLEIDLLVDEPPRFAMPAFLKPDMPAKADVLRGFGFGVRAWDDYGVSRTVLKWRQSRLEDRNTITAQGEVERQNVPPVLVTVAEFTKVFADREVRPGDVLSFYVEVADNREPAAQVVVSPTYSFFIHQDDLGSGALGADGDLMFGSFGMREGRGRFARHRETAEVPQPQELRGVSKLVSDFDGNVTSGSRPPSVIGDFGRRVEEYFKIMSSAVYAEDDKE